MARRPTPKAIQKLLASAGGDIADRLPSKWMVSIASRTPNGGVIRFVSPAGDSFEVRAFAQRRIDPRAAVGLPDFDEPTIVIADWLSPRTKAILADRGQSFADTTGNLSISLDEPLVVIQADGATRDPAPRPKTLSSLRGPRAWALERALAEVVPPYGLGDLAEALNTDAGYISRLLTGLGEELLIERQPRQPIERVDWEAMIRQVTRTYSLLADNETTSWIAPAGPEQFLRDLSSSKLKRWAVTGSFASSRLVTVAAPEIAVVYTDDPERLAETVRLRPTRTGGNVVTAFPYDPIVYGRTWEQDGLVFASLAQVAIDCLTGFGRMPAEGEALLDWMRDRAPHWQSPSLSEDAELV
jgi:hypothetical protein